MREKGRHAAGLLILYFPDFLCFLYLNSSAIAALGVAHATAGEVVPHAPQAPS